MRFVIFAFFIQLLSLSALAGNVSGVFLEGVFGTEWGDAKSEVISLFPKGKEKNDFGITNYTIKDGRKLFGQERNIKNYIRFTFDSNDSLIAVSIEFPIKSSENFGALLTKLNTTFGESESVPNSFGVSMVKWPEEKGISIGLSHIPGTFSMGELIFSIESKATPKPVSKGDLGF